ncbi:hypothetical protein FHW58_003363 [Duganella sp. 1224]|uniref:Atrophin-1 multi-domain protein n=1 Tax=Duganella sp. 1224 TaxID=2587052 RepID=UPI0015C9CAE4|nr:Atrophin-1 multi-domain protein [Duganella sp. 1224]NYE62148.1 hypothetical protein [Duganella sp. 1224]
MLTRFPTNHRGWKYSLPLAATIVLAACAQAQTTDTTTTTRTYGTHTTPFAANSLWNSRPVNPVFDNSFVIPKSLYYPSISNTVYSTGAFKAVASDPAVTVYPLTDQPGVWDPDAEANRPTVVIPHWPADVAPATGGDGHADIIDTTTNIVHSFWKLQKGTDGKWRARTYAWTKLTGSGWGDPAHYYQGARAAAVPPTGGLIRKEEVNDGDTMFRHALALSLTFNALSPNPAYVYPATSADVYAANRNSGKIPEGALLMLPPDYDTSTIVSPILRKIANTLKTYGGYVIDQNDGTPYAIYAEIGSNIALHQPKWDPVAAAELERIRLGLRMVKATQFISGDGKQFTSVPTTAVNTLSMRGPWVLKSGPTLGTFDTLRQAVVFPSTTVPIVQNNPSNRSLGGVSWALPAANTTQRLTAITTGGGKIRLQLTVDNKVVADTGELANGASARLVWPANAKTVLWAISGTGGPSTVSGTLVRVAN